MSDGVLQPNIDALAALQPSARSGDGRPPFDATLSKWTRPRAAGSEDKGTAEFPLARLKSGARALVGANAALRLAQTRLRTTLAALHSAEGRPAAPAQSEGETGANTMSEEINAVEANMADVEKHIACNEAELAALSAGLGPLVDADLGAEAARLKALQLAQALQTQQASLGEGTPSMLVALFK